MSEQRVTPPDPRSDPALLWTEEDVRGGIGARFERVAGAFPDLVAIYNEGRSVSYGALNTAANRIAHAVFARLGESNVPVASLLSERVHVIEALLGVLKAGQIHTPLVPEQPAPRLQQILDDARPPLVLVDAAHRALAAQLGLPPERLLDLDTLGPGLPDHNPRVPLARDGYAYIIYTSGSTGRPKGVAYPLDKFLRSLARSAPYGNWTPGKRMPLLASPGYAAGAGGILIYLLQGATTCVFVLEQHGLAGLHEFLVQQRITTFGMTASTFRHFMATLRPDDRFPDVTQLALYGEPVLRRDFELFKQHFRPETEFTTGLGSTEAGAISGWSLRGDSVVSERVLPTGYLISDFTENEVYLVDEDGKRVETGVAGEIVVKGENLAEYWNNPELNARAFAPDPDGSAKRIFRTGDMGRLRADGLLEHHGRKDFQVKVRGNRIELGEIEMALFELNNIREAVVVARPDAAGETQLIAYVVPALQPGPSAGWLRRRLAESLPAFMLPAAFVSMPALPLTLSGKIDRAQLPAPDLARAAPVAARDALETQLAQLWAELLHLPSVGSDEDFFELGGNSLLAMRLFADIQRTLGRKLPLSVLFQASTIAELAALIRADETAPRAQASLVPIQPRGTRRPFFLAAGGYGGDAELLVYARLSRYLGNDQPFYGLRARAVGRGRDANAEVEAIAAAHIAEVRAVQPSGPYLLGGECIGGVVAVEMARQLRAQGESVALLCLLDTVRPSRQMSLSGYDGLLAQGRRHARRVAGVLRHPRHYAQRAARALAGTRLGSPSAPAENAYMEATARYRPRAPLERITLLINEEYHRVDPTLGWRSLAPGVEIHALPGTHDSYIRQNVQSTGECLRDCLDRAQ